MFLVVILFFSFLFGPIIDLVYSLSCDAVESARMITMQIPINYHISCWFAGNDLSDIWFMSRNLPCDYSLLVERRLFNEKNVNWIDDLVWHCNIHHVFSWFLQLIGCKMIQIEWHQMSLATKLINEAHSQSVIMQILVYFRFLPMKFHIFFCWFNKTKA